MRRAGLSRLRVQFAVLGWCIEWMQAWLLVADDVMDDSLTRRGQPCWYRQKHVGMIALNDAFTIEMLVYKVWDGWVSGWVGR